MLNQIVLVGRIKTIKSKELSNGKKMTEVELAVQRTFKNADGVYETDIIPVVMWNLVAEKTAEFVGENDLVGVKGRIQSNNNKLEVIAEKVTFLSSKSEAKE